MAAHTTMTESPAAGEFTRIVLLVFRLHGRLLAAGDELTGEIGLTSALWQVLGAIDQRASTRAEIARAMGLTRQSVRRTVNVLLDKGFVELCENPAHQRARLVALTPDGRAVFDAAMRLNAEWSSRVTRGMDAARLAAAGDVVEELLERL